MNNDAKDYILLLFDGYKKRKQENRLYSHDNVPKIIISEYLNIVEKPSFHNLINIYKQKYIFYESRVEPNFSKEETLGLASVYDYIQEFDFNKTNFNVFICSMLIHNKLYAKCGDGSFGGKLRESTAILQDLNIEVLPPQEAIIAFNDYIAKGDFLKSKYENGDIFGYIDDCIKLNVELIKLQPFADGNKRTFRALLNLLFKRLHIPPVYIEVDERNEYKKALIKALNAKEEKDYDDIIQFYYYKICDSIITLDINNSELSNANYKTK